MSPIAIESSFFFIFLYIMLLSNLLSTIDGIHMNEITKKCILWAKNDAHYWNDASNVSSLLKVQKAWGLRLHKEFQIAEQSQIRKRKPCWLFIAHHWYHLRMWCRQRHYDSGDEKKTWFTSLPASAKDAYNVWSPIIQVKILIVVRLPSLIITATWIIRK